MKNVLKIRLRKNGLTPDPNDMTAIVSSMRCMGCLHSSVWGDFLPVYGVSSYLCMECLHRGMKVHNT
jgi:hypothetical protein